MIISGTLAGLGGVVHRTGTFENFFVQGSSLSIGFDGMAVSLLGSGSSIGILLSALLFSILKLGGQGMQFAGIPSELVDVNIAIIIFFVAISFVIRFLLAKIFDGKEALVVQEIEAQPNDQDQGRNHLMDISLISSIVTQTLIYASPDFDGARWRVLRAQRDR